MPLIETDFIRTFWNDLPYISRFCLVDDCFSVLVTKYLTEMNLWTEEFIFSHHFESVQSITEETVWQQSDEAACSYVDGSGESVRQQALEVACSNLDRPGEV